MDPTIKEVKQNFSLADCITEKDLDVFQEKWNRTSKRGKNKIPSEYKKFLLYTACSIIISLLLVKALSNLSCLHLPLEKSISVISELAIEQTPPVNSTTPLELPKVEDTHTNSLEVNLENEIRNIPDNENTLEAAAPYPIESGVESSVDELKQNSPKDELSMATREEEKIARRIYKDLREVVRFRRETNVSNLRFQTIRIYG